ncbi:hypothetical protein HP532_01190 [Pseudomonas sp. CrR25]|nr:hypothetical protein [Pseudomonas sp. CrR25]
MTDIEKTFRIEKITKLITGFGVTQSALLMTAAQLNINLLIRIPRLDTTIFIIGSSVYGPKIPHTASAHLQGEPEQDRPIKLSEKIEYFEITPDDYLKIRQESTIHIHKFDRVIDLQNNTEPPVELGINQYISKYHNRNPDTAYYSGHFGVFDGNANKHPDELRFIPKNDKFIPITFNDLHIKPADINIILGIVKSKSHKEPWLSDKIVFLNNINIECFGIFSEMKNKTLEETKKLLEVLIKNNGGIGKNNEKLLEAAVNAVLPDSLLKTRHNTITLDRSILPSICSQLTSTTLIAVNHAALKLWEIKIKSLQKTYPRQTDIQLLLAELQVPSNIRINFPSIIRPETELGLNKRKINPY